MTRGAVGVLLALALLLAVASPAAAAGPLFNRSGFCINPRPSTPPVLVSQPGDEFDVYAQPDAALMAFGRRVRDAVQPARLQARVRTFFAASGRTIQPRKTIGADRPMRIFVVPTLFVRGAAGADISQCGDNRRGAIVMPADIPASENITEVVAHELFHLFQDGTLGAGLQAGWWTEATAEFSNQSLFDHPLDPGNRDDRFLGFPETPLDFFRFGTGDVHQYGAFRFVQWLNQHMPARRFWSMLIETFRGVGPADAPLRDQTAVLARELRDVGRDLDADLGRFWADHLEDTPTNGRAGTRIRVPVPSGRSQFARNVRGLAARLFDLRPRSGVTKVHVEARTRHADEHLWVRAGSLRERDAIDTTYCVTTSRGATLPQLPSDLAYAFTNGTRERRAFRVALTGLTDRTGCGRTPTPTPTPPTCRGLATGGLTAGVCRPPEAPCGYPDFIFGPYDALPEGANDARTDLHVILNQDCKGGEPSLLSVGGHVPCRTPNGSIIAGNLASIATDDASFTVDEDAPGGRASVTYSPSRGITVDLTVQFSRMTARGTSTATGTVRLRGTNNPSCDSGTLSFSVPWRRENR